VARVEIRRLIWWPENEAKLRDHRITRDEVDAMIRRNAWVIGTHEDYPGQIRITGVTPDGRFITVGMAPTGDLAVWRPVTGWGATDDELDYYWEQMP
jgi:hypothetical protein